MDTDDLDFGLIRPREALLVTVGRVNNYYVDWNYIAHGICLLTPKENPSPHKKKKKKKRFKQIHQGSKSHQEMKEKYNKRRVTTRKKSKQKKRYKG